MLQTLNSALVSLGYEPVDAIVKENHQIWYELALKQGVPANVLNVIIEESGLATNKAQIKLTADLSINSDSFVYYDKSEVVQNDNDEFMDKFLSYHVEKSLSYGATSVSISEGRINYVFGTIPVQATKIPVGIAGTTSKTIVSNALSDTSKESLLNFSQLALSSARPLIMVFGHQRELRAAYLSGVLSTQGSRVRTVDIEGINEEFLSNPPEGYTIALSAHNSFTDYLSLSVKGDKLKADKLAQLWNASQSEIQMPQVCGNCVIKVPLTAFSIPEKGFSLTATVGVSANPSGCECCFKGYSGSFSLFESFSVDDRKMVELISVIGIQEATKSEYTKVQTELSSRSLQPIYSLLEKSVNNGQVSVSDAKRTLL